MGNGAGSLGGGIGAGEDAGAGMEVPAVRESVEGGRGGSWNEEEEARRPLLEELRNEEGRSTAIVEVRAYVVVSRTYRLKGVDRWKGLEVTFHVVNERYQRDGFNSEREVWIIWTRRKVNRLVENESKNWLNQTMELEPRRYSAPLAPHHVDQSWQAKVLVMNLIQGRN